jgi:DNA polymerase-3 subunit delta'
MDFRGVTVDFSGITGQKDVVDALKASLTNNRIGHAYIFSGPCGIGKKTVAHILSSILMCSGGREVESCGQCKSCLLFENGSNPDYCVLEVEGSSIGVEEIRGLQRDISIKPLYSQKKVYLIPEAEKITVQAQNCLLKTLEEPPVYGVIILVTSNYDALLETIRSRCVRYDFKRNTFDEVKGFLTNKFGLEYNEADFIASYANGVIGRAIELLESEDLEKVRDRVIDALVKLKGAGREAVYEINALLEESKDDVESILDIMLLFYRDLLVVGKYGNENILINSDKKDIILENAWGFSMEKLLDNIAVIEETRRDIKKNANFQLAIEVMLMKLQEENE